MPLRPHDFVAPTDTLVMHPIPPCDYRDPNTKARCWRGAKDAIHRKERQICSYCWGTDEAGRCQCDDPCDRPGCPATAMDQFGLFFDYRSIPIPTFESES